MEGLRAQPQISSLVLLMPPKSLLLLQAADMLPQTSAEQGCAPAWPEMSTRQWRECAKASCGFLSLPGWFALDATILTDRGQSPSINEALETKGSFFSCRAHGKIRDHAQSVCMLIRFLSVR